MGLKVRHTVCDDGDALGVQTVHHCGQHFELVLHGMREEIRVDEDGVRGDESGVVLEEER